MNINFSNVPDFEERKFIPLPEGEYKTLLYSMSIKKSKNNEPMLICEFKVLNDPTEFTNRIIKEFYVLTNELGLGKLKKLLEKSNVDISDNVDIEQLVSSGDLLGNKYNMKIKTNEYTNNYGKNVISNKLDGFCE